jgi:flagellar hook assembly protein FlgD
VLAQLSLNGIFPNPFRESVAIKFQSGLLHNPTVAVLDMMGKTVRTLTGEETGPSAFRVTWDGKDANSKAVAAGVYFIRLKCGDAIVTKKILKQH